jgi:hypothetical protein
LNVTAEPSLFFCPHIGLVGFHVKTDRLLLVKFHFAATVNFVRPPKKRKWFFVSLVSAQSQRIPSVFVENNTGAHEASGGAVETAPVSWRMWKAQGIRNGNWR